MNQLYLVSHKNLDYLRFKIPIQPNRRNMRGLEFSPGAYNDVSVPMRRNRADDNYILASGTTTDGRFGNSLPHAPDWRNWAALGPP